MSHPKSLSIKSGGLAGLLSRLEDGHDLHISKKLESVLSLCQDDGTSVHSHHSGGNSRAAGPSRIGEPRWSDPCFPSCIVDHHHYGQQVRPSESQTLCDLLEQSRTFASPSAEDDMAVAWGLQDCLVSLRGSLFSPVPSVDTVTRLRAGMKARVARGWSMEALGRGVKLAREGRAPEAIPHYLKALELDPTNPDAHVALGAAHANAGSWQEAADAMAAALALDPDHANALAYERRIAQRAKEEGVALTTLRRAGQPGPSRPGPEGLRPVGEAPRAASPPAPSDLQDDDAVDWPRSPSPERGEGLDLRRALRIVKKHRRQKGGAQQGHKTKHKRRHSKSRKHKHRSGD
uniref:Uncharacterized protein n=2 Tax=Auxenochlorella protothecoides TaxID=3075 RepID=A0A1D2A5E6_AUXPR